MVELVSVTEMLWVFKGVPYPTIIERIEERRAVECWSAFEHHRRNPGYAGASLDYAADMAFFYLRTAKVMQAQESEMRARLLVAAREQKVRLLDVAVCGSLELYALMIECFVRMNRQGIPYPEHSPLALFTRSAPKSCPPMGL